MKRVRSSAFGVRRPRGGAVLSGRARPRWGPAKDRVLGAGLMLFAALLSADSARSIVAEGNALYAKNKHEAALQKYTRAQALLPNNPLLSYNMGNVYFRQKDYDKAVEAYGKAAQAPDRALAAAAYYNAGNARFAQEDYLQAIEMYKQALDLDPEDRDAKANLELARRKLKEQTKPQPQEQKQQQQGQQQQQPQEQDQGEQGERQQPQPKPGEEKRNQKEEGVSKAEELSKEEAERLLQALRSKDRDEQKKQKQKVPLSGARGGQDW